MGRGGVVPLFCHFRPSSPNAFSDSHGVARGLVIASFSTRSILDSNSLSSLNNSTKNLVNFSDFSHLPGARIPKKPTKLVSRRILEISKEQASSAFNHCVSLVRQHDFQNYVGALFSPRKAQPQIFSILALNVELAQIRGKVTKNSKDTTGIYRLQFWKDTLAAIFNQQTGPVPRQPIAVALCAFGSTSPYSLLENLVTARQQTIGDKQFATIKQASDYGLLTTGSIIKLWMDAISSDLNGSLLDHPEAVKAAEHLGVAYSLANMIRSALPLLSQGIVLLPGDLCTIHGISPDRLYNQKQIDESKGLIRDITKVAEDELQKARSLSDKIPKELRTALMSSAATCDFIIRLTKKVDYSLFDTRLQTRHAALPWTLLWQSLRGSY